MRTFEEIEAEIRAAMRDRDSGALKDLAVEMRDLGTERAEAVGMAAQGNADEFIGDYQSALEHYRRAIELYEIMGDRSGVARVTGYMGIVYRNIGDYPAAVECYQRALVVYEEQENRAGIALVTNNIGIVHGVTGNYATSLEYYQRALALHEELGSHANAAFSTNNMGMVSWATGDYQSALEHFQRAFAVHNELGDRAGLANVAGNMGNVYLDSDDLPSALEHYQQALSLYEELGDRAGIARVTGNIIEALLKQGTVDDASKLLDHQADMLMEEPDVRVAHAAHRAQIHEYHGDLDAAHQELRNGLQITVQAGLRDTMAELHRSLRDLAQKQNDFAGYVEHNNEYMRITEEVKGREATQKLAMMEAERKMEAERRERQKERALLYGTLPKEVAERLIKGETVNDQFDHAAVLFADIVGFTTHTSTMQPAEVTAFLEEIYRRFDTICEEHSATKVKTIGDSYLAFAGSLPSVRDDARHPERGGADEGPQTSALRIAAVALAMKRAEFYWPSASANSNSNRIQLRIGVHCGPVTAGVIGKERLQYDIWGDTVNVASRMESTGEPGRIQVSSEFHEQLSSRASPSHSLERGASEGGGVRFWTTERGTIDIKGKGTMTTYWLEPAT